MIPEKPTAFGLFEKAEPTAPALDLAPQ